VETLPLGQNVMVVLPYIVMLIAITVVCFAVSYLVFSPTASLGRKLYILAVRGLLPPAHSHHFQMSK
jgi:hypothetical protein